MAWKHAAFDWNCARALLATAEEGSLSAAARALGLTQPTLGRQVASLEAELGVVLFERIGNKLVLTSTGYEIVEQVRTMSEAATRLSLIAAGQAQSIEGLVRIAASEAVSTYLLPPIVAELRERHPAVEVEIVVSNQSSDLKRREADIAVRHVRPKDGELVARKIKDKSLAHLYASPSYLARIGHPETPKELAARAVVIGFDETDVLQRSLQAMGLPFTEDQFPVRSENHVVQWELAKQGIGMCIMMEEVGDREPKLRRALPSSEAAISFPTWLICHRELKTSKRIRVVFDLLADLLSAALSPSSDVA